MQMKCGREGIDELINIGYFLVFLCHQRIGDNSCIPDKLVIWFLQRDDIANEVYVADIPKDIRSTSNQYARIN